MDSVVSQWERRWKTVERRIERGPILGCRIAKGVLSNGASSSPGPPTSSHQLNNYIYPAIWCYPDKPRVRQRQTWEPLSTMIRAVEPQSLGYEPMNSNSRRIFRIVDAHTMLSIITVNISLSRPDTSWILAQCRSQPIGHLSS